MTPGLFRLFLATVVVFSHFSRFDLGAMAVDLFFVLSGYWICRMWREKYMTAKNPYTTFIASRFGRLMPTFLLANAIAIGTHWLAGEQLEMPIRSLISNAAILGYSSIVAGDYLTPAWSLDIEIQYYLVAPIIMAAIATRPRFAWRWLVALSLTAFVYLVVKSEPRLALVWSYSTYFVIGLAAATLDWRPRKGFATASAVITAAVVIGMVLLPSSRNLILGGKNPDLALFQYNAGVCAVLAVIAAPFALWTVRLRAPAWDKMAGDLSYVVYLVHWEALWFVQRYWSDLPHLERAPYVGAALAAAYAGAFVIWRYYDRPINIMREKLVFRAARRSDCNSVRGPDADAAAIAGSRNARKS
jgi:peptidoglycan/LPS O-acetylase OafA/YrhL